MFDTKLQTPISSQVLKKARKKAASTGFSSVNEVVRLILNQYIEGKINFTISVDSKNILYVSDKEQVELEKILDGIKSRGEDNIVESDVVTI